VRPAYRASRQTPGENPLLGVQPVLGLVKDNGLRAVHDFVRYLFAAMRWQTMHEDGIGPRFGHEPSVHLVAPQQIVTPRPVAVAHGRPGVGDHAIGALDRLLGVGKEVDRRARRFDPVGKPFSRF
jgi:hypothetical protein